MPMGMQAASAHYQRSMDLLLGHLQPRIAISYIDDICIFSDTWEQHMLDVATVIDRVGGAGFKFKPSKCRIGKSTVKFLGYEVSGDGCVRPDAERVASLVNLDAKAVCSDLTALQNWIGVVQYYSRFIPRSALILGPMQEQLNDKCRSPPNEECLKAFGAMREALTTEGGPVLIRPDFDKEFILLTDVCLVEGWRCDPGSAGRRGTRAACGLLLPAMGCVGEALGARGSRVRHCARRHEALPPVPLRAPLHRVTDAEPLVWLRSVKNLRAPRKLDHGAARAGLHRGSSTWKHAQECGCAVKAGTSHGRPVAARLGTASRYRGVARG